MRDIENYEKQFADHPFERIMEKYRRKYVKETINKYYHGVWGGVLEIGCGLQPLFIDYDDSYKFTVVEPALSCYENAKARSLQFKNVSVIRGFFEDAVALLEGKEFDIVICACLLHEVENPHQLLQSIARVCRKNDTVVYLSVPNAFSLHRLLAKKMGIITDVHQLSDTNQKLQQHNVFDVDSLKNLVESEGFKVISSGSILLKPFTHSQMQKIIDARIIDAEVLDALDAICSSQLKEFGSEIYINMKLL